jgi:uncharacterized protein YxjI
MSTSEFMARDQYFVRERVAFAKLTDAYDILDPATQAVIGVAKERPPTWAKWLRLLVNKALMPTDVYVTEGGETGPLLFRIHRGASLWRAKVTVHDAGGAQLGFFKSKLFSLGGGFWVHDVGGAQVAEVKGDWKGWNFRLLDTSQRELGVVTKKWAGIGKELFTSADNYVVALSPAARERPGAAVLLLAAALSIDIVFKEKQ